MTARCKFRVKSVTIYSHHERVVDLEASYDEPLSKEDRAFAKYTPNGQMTVTITNPSVFDVFKPESYVYIDITPAQE